MKTLARLADRFGGRRAVGVVLLVLLLGLRIWDPAPLEELRLKSFDFYQVVKPREAAARPVVIVDIDEASLAALGQWPWPRTIVADLVAQLKRLGSVAIAFDIIFAEPDRMSPNVAVESFRNLDDETKAKLRNLPSNDEVLASVMRQSRVILGQSGVPFASPQAGTQDLPRTGFAIMGPDPGRWLVTFDGLLHNVPVLEQAAAGRGLLTIRPERDGIVRRVPIVMKVAGVIVPALTLEMLRVVTNSGAIIVRSDDAGITGVAIPGLQLPTDKNGQLWVNFAPHDPARYVPAKDVLAGRVGPDRIAGKLVLIGTSAVGLLDLKTTPIDAAMPGVEVQAQVLENALTRSLLAHPNYAIALELAAALVVGIAIIVLAPMIGALPLLALGATLAAGLTAVSWFFYSQKSLLLDLTFPLLSSFVIYIVLVFISYLREQVDRRRIRSAFGQYLSPALVEQLAQSPEKLVLGGEERNMTIMFSDVRGFTTISESYKHDPQGLTQLMNRFLTPLTNAIIDQKGTIDKYMGDAIMAFWNAPLDDAAHEINACEAALDMLDRVEALNRVREQEAKSSGTRFVEIKIGVGLNTGPCVVGNMGSDLRFDYSVLGDSVNLASRLEGQTKSYGLPIIIGARTAQAAKDKFALLEVDYITVKGKTEPEVIYTILGRRDVAASSQFESLYELSAKMLKRYRSREWDAVMAIIEASRGAAGHFGLDGLLELYCERVRVFRENPPPDDWNGAYALETK